MKFFARALVENNYDFISSLPLHFVKRHAEGEVNMVAEPMAAILAVPFYFFENGTAGMGTTLFLSLRFVLAPEVSKPSVRTLTESGMGTSITSPGVNRRFGS